MAIRAASVLVDGEEFVAFEDHPVVVGRADADGILGLDASDMGISRVAASVEVVDGECWIVNDSSKRALLLELPGGSGRLSLEPSERFACTTAPMSVIVPGALFSHVLEIVVSSADTTGEGSPYAGAGETNTIVNTSIGAGLTGAAEMPTRKERQLESEATRVRLLEAGLELLRDNPDAAIADVLTARKVYAKAKSSSGGFYEHFHSQQYYVEQLTAYALSMDPVPELDESMKAFLEALADGKGAHEAIISGGAAGLRVADDDMTIPLTLMLRARARPGNLAMRQIQEMYELVNGQAVEPYEAVLAMTHREVRPPYSIRDVVTAITALNEGLQLRRLALPEDVPDESLGSMMLAILELYTRPIGDKRSSSDWIDEIGKDWSVSSSGQRS